MRRYSWDEMVRVGGCLKRQPKLKAESPPLDAHLSVLGMPTRAHNGLLNVGCRTVGDVVTWHQVKANRQRWPEDRIHADD